LLWAVGFALVQIATLAGCKTLAKGPETCLVLGADMGGLLYNMLLMSWFLLAGAIFWVPIGLVLIAVIRYLRRNSF
jgi:heme/copper-type cytochrome/quinol oxidase subunit 2